MSRRENINLILDSIQSDYSELYSLYEESLQGKSLNPQLILRIKNYLENARSILDYIARDIADNLKIPKENKVYFPLVESSKNVDSFKGSVGRNLPGLEEANQKLFNAIEKLQPYRTENAWLGNLVELVNIHKHDSLVPQKRTETERIKSEHAGGGSVSWDPSSVRFGSGVYINGAQVNPFTQMPEFRPDTIITKERWVDFQFDIGGSVSAIGLIREIKDKLPEIVDNLYAL